MGELRLGQTTGSAAPWDLENVPDLTQWRWSPPSSAARRVRQHLRSGHKSLFKTVVHSSLHPLSTLWGVVSTLIHPATLSVQQADATPLDFVELGFAQISQDLSKDATLGSTPKFLEYCQYLERALADGRLKGSDVTVLFSNLHQGLCALASDQLCGPAVLSTVQNLVLTLIRTVATGVTALNKSGPCVTDSQLYSSLLQALSEANQQQATQVLRTVIESIPQQCMEFLAREIDLVLEQFLFSAAKKIDTGAATSQQERELVDTWSILDSTRHLTILNAATRTAIAAPPLGERNLSQLRMIWLTILARLPDVSMDYLATACACAEAGSSAVPLSEKNVCDILLAHLSKYDLVLHHDTAEPQLQTPRTLRTRRLSPLYGLGEFLSKSGDVLSLLRAAKFLALAGREQDIWQLLRGARTMIESNKHELCRRKMPLFDLAFATQHLPLIIRVLEKYACEPNLTADRYWHSHESLADLTRITFMRTPGRLQVIDALRLGPIARGQPVSKLPHKASVQTQKAVRLAQAAVANASRSPRAAFETVFHCVNFVRRREEMVPSSLLKCVHQLVKNDLESGRSGVQVRLNWYLDLVGMKSGADTRLKTAQSLQTWRKHNQRLARLERLQTQH